MTKVTAKGFKILRYFYTLSSISDRPAWAYLQTITTSVSKNPLHVSRSYHDQNNTDRTEGRTEDMAEDCHKLCILRKAHTLLMFKSCKANLGNTNSLFKICSDRAKQASPLSDISLTSKFPSAISPPTTARTFPEVLCVHSPAARPETKNQITLV